MSQQEPLNMPLEEAMRTQRAIRRLKSDPVDDSLVLHVLELAMKAPTGSNAQNWEFIVVKDREVVAKLGRLNRLAMNAFGPIYKRTLQKRMDDKMLRIEKAVRWQAGPLRRYPRGRGGMPQRCHCALSDDRGQQRLRLYLPRGAKPLVGGPRGRAGRGADHHAAVEHVRGEASPGLAVERHSVRGDPSWLADRQIRSHDAQTGRGIRFA
jgi:hypothetical protein